MTFFQYVMGAAFAALLLCSLKMLDVSAHFSLRTASKHTEFFSKETVTDDWPQMAGLDQVTERVRK